MVSGNWGRAAWRVSAAGVAMMTMSVGCDSTDSTVDLSKPDPTELPLGSASATASPSAAPALDTAQTSEAEAEAALADADTPVVDLSGVATPPKARDPNRPAVGSIAMLTPVFERPDTSGTKLGFLRAGAIIEAEPIEIPPGAGCNGGFRKIKPAGYVCLDEKATLDLDHPILRATTRRPDITEKLPYMYGTVTRGGPAYARIPTAENLSEFEPTLKTHISKWKKDEVSGAGYGLDVWLKWTKREVPGALEAYEQRVTDDVIPWYLDNGGVVPNLSGLVSGPDAVKIDQVDRRQGVAFIDSFLYDGRRYNVGTDLRVIPADRFRPIRGSDYHGVRIGKDVAFPFALIRRPGAKKWIWDGKRMTDGGNVEWRAAINLTGKQKMYGKKLHYEAVDGYWLDDRHASRIDPAKRMPKWGSNGEKWIDINLTKQALVAYEGETAVYATLVSSGEDGLGDPEETKSTIRGIYRIHTKHVSITMDSQDVGEEFELRDVPYVQYFKEGYALHGAYWHDSFGRPKSHGCINLSPEDARRLFWWTGPHVPAGWHGAAKTLTGTVVFIHP